VQVGQRLADRHRGNPGDGDQLAGPGLLSRHAVQRLADVELRDLGALNAPVGAAPGDLLPLPDRPLEDAAEREPAQVGRGIEVRHQSLQRMPLGIRRRRDMRRQRLEERLEIRRELVRRQTSLAGARIRVHDRELDLVLVGVQVEEERVDLVDDLGDSRVRPVDLVHHQDHGQARFEGLAQDEARLRQRPLARVDEQEDAVHHRQAALHLAAEVRVARRVDDVDLQAAVADGRVLGQDRDALLALEIQRVEHALGHVLVLPEGAGLPEHGVDERRLPVVDVGDDRDISDVCAQRHSPRVASRVRLAEPRNTCLPYSVEHSC
jgi:hypothetical protein